MGLQTESKGNEDKAKYPKADKYISNNAPVAISAHFADKRGDLLALVWRLWQGKWWIALVTLLALGLAGIYLLLAKPKWTSRAIVTLPDTAVVADYSQSLHVLYYNRQADLPTVNYLQNRFFDRFYDLLQSLPLQLKNRPVREDIEIEPLIKGSKLPLLVSYRAHSAQEAQQVLSRYLQKADEVAINGMLADLKVTIHARLAELNQNMAVLQAVAEQKKQRRMEVLRQALKVAQQSGIEQPQVREAELLSDETLFVLGSKALGAMLKNEASYPLPLTADWFNTQQAILAIRSLTNPAAKNNRLVTIDNSQPATFYYVMKPVLAVYQDSPKPALVIFLALVMGLMGGSLLVLTMQALAEYRQQKS